jgi:protocatechuate 3,4-dioxygenase beta subunit
VVIRVELGGEISGTVVDGAGHPVADARVAFGSGEGATTDAYGRYATRGLSAGTYGVVATTPRQGSDNRLVLLSRGEHVRVDLVVATSSLAGIVVDARGQRVDGAQVLARFTATDGLTLEYSDDGGWFDFGGLPPGAYQVFARRKRSRVDGPFVEVTTSNRRLRLTVPDPEATAP